MTVGCVACAAANPHLSTTPFPIPQNDSLVECLMTLLKGGADAKCPQYHPLVTRKPKIRSPGEIYVLPANYTCFNNDDRSGISLGIFADGFCVENSTVDCDLSHRYSNGLLLVMW
ncbi:hypothetical protein GDO81_013769 [Engystomops pustulosus]|uniref:Uncharacterized protein n=1 Tax=Engystomops pustulosus TaxID=76066 RepID=A0AAV7B5F8_ENGPU|nr:hypothetical protein GDO81_013769 [Engystomops pustulosus]